MDQDRKYVISKTLNGNTIYFIARNKGGNIFARELTLEKLHDAIKAYKEPPTPKPEAHAKSVSANSKSSEQKKTEPIRLAPLQQDSGQALAQGEFTEPPQETGATSIESNSTTSEPKKKFLQNDIKEQIEEKKSRSSKKSFWDKLK